MRLCLKELRESLRDRRTIVTLILMPLLVYPLLSLVLNRVLLTGIDQRQGSQLTFGFASELKGSGLQSVLGVGLALLEERQSAPIYFERAIEFDQFSAERQELDEEAKKQEPQVMFLQGDGRRALGNGSVDILLVRKSTLEAEQTNASGKRLIRDLLKRYQDSSNPNAAFDADKFLNLIGSYEVHYRRGDSRSERALQLLERILAAYNNETARELLGAGYKPPFRLAATPVAIKSNYSDLLATMVPLVLVLMTMAGAVYPAIDLTAGERERGTMEALIVSPMPSAALLFAKYTAVVTVALLTALANLAAMTVTLWVSGIGKLVFGNGVLSTGVIGTVLVLLVLFTMFFAALLLAVTSFAKSFKEAQAYLIPLMLLALSPGVMSLLPGIEFTSLLATVPLVNIVLLARQVLVGAAEWNTAMVAVICNGIYALAALAVASRLFGANASMHGSQGSWRDLLTRPMYRATYPGIDQMALTMAVMFPIYFIVSSALPRFSSELSTRLWISSGISFALILGLPLIVSLYRRIEFASTYRLTLGSALRWLAWLPAIVLISCSAWMAAHEILIGGLQIGIGTIGEEHMEDVAHFRDQLRELPLWMVLFVFALTPAICEEFLFRGFVLSAFHRNSAAWAVVLSATMFGLMHVLTSNVLAIERFLPTTFMGLILGFIAVRTGSIWPGMILHACHNGLLLSLAYFQDEVQAYGLLVEEGTHLPTDWLIGGAVALCVGLLLFWASTLKKKEALESPIDETFDSPVSEPEVAVSS